MKIAVLCCITAFVIAIVWRWADMAELQLQQDFVLRQMLMREMVRKGEPKVETPHFEEPPTVRKL